MLALDQKNSAPTSPAIGVPFMSPPSPCDTCQFRGRTFCGKLAEAGAMKMHPVRHSTKRARQNVTRMGEPVAGIGVICEGWAVRYAQLPDGRRQILSVLLPGETMRAASLSTEGTGVSVQAVTDVRYCYLNAADVRRALPTSVALMDEWAGLVTEEITRYDEQLIDIGQRTAKERVAGFILRIMKRCEERGLVVDGSFPFPLKQQHIAEATGLTPVHVCRVLSAFRKEKIAQIANYEAKILSLVGLQRIAQSKH